jgi:hypothetical protein
MPLLTCFIGAVALDCSGVVNVNLGDAPFLHAPNDGKDGEQKKKKSKKDGKSKGKKTPRGGKKKSPRGGSKDKSTSNDNDNEAEAEAEEGEQSPAQAVQGDAKGKEKADTGATHSPPDSADTEPAPGWRLVDPYTFVYRPPCAWPKSTKFTVQVRTEEPYAMFYVVAAFDDSHRSQIPSSVVSFYNEPIEAFSQEYNSQTPYVLRTSVEDGEAQVLDPTIAICFDQKIDPTEVIKHIQVRNVLSLMWRSVHVSLAGIAEQRCGKGIGITMAFQERWHCGSGERGRGAGAAHYHPSHCQFPRRQVRAVARLPVHGGVLAQDSGHRRDRQDPLSRGRPHRFQELLQL